MPKLIKAARGKVDPETVNKYFDNLEISLEGVPRENILNFDKNVTDDHAYKQVIVKGEENTLSK